MDVFVWIRLLLARQSVGGVSEPVRTEQDYYWGPDGSVGSSPIRTDLGLL